jgi:DNA-binding transcriptional LysR family regulator
MQVESLKTFCDLVETQSFTRAASVNHVSQSAVSQTVAAMEREFHSLLIERSRKNFRLTAEGELVYDHCKRILQSFEAIQSEIQELKHVVSGSIRIATVYSIGLHKIPPYLKAFLKSFPTVNVQVEYRRPNKVYEDVLANTVDLGLVNFPTPHPKLEVIPMPEEPLVLVCHPRHPLAKLKAIPLKVLNGRKFVSFQADIPTRQAVDKMFRHEAVTVEHVSELDNIETLKQMVELDAGVSILPAGTVALEIGKQTLAAVRLAGRHTRKWGVIHKKGKVLSPAMKQFVELLKNRCNETG